MPTSYGVRRAGSHGRVNQSRETNMTKQQIGQLIGIGIAVLVAVAAVFGVNVEVVPVF